MKKILVTGGNGVLGSSFKDINFLKKNQKKYKFILTDSSIVDLRNQKKTIKFIFQIKPHGIIHLAGSSGGLGRSSANHASIFRDNLYMMLNILEGARLSKVKKVVMTLSSGMYPQKSKLPYNEKNIHNGEPLNYNYGNSYSKRMMDVAIRSYREEFKMDIIGLIVCGIYGENDNFNLEEANMLPAVIKRIFEAKKKNKKKLKLWGTGKPFREYTYSKDFRDILMWMYENYSSKQSINVSSGQEMRIKNIVKLICEELNYDFKQILFDKSKPDGIYRKSTDLSKFKKIYKYNFTSFKDGLKNTIQWYKKNKVNAQSKSKFKNLIF